MFPRFQNDVEKMKRLTSTLRRRWKLGVCVLVLFLLKFLIGPLPDANTWFFADSGEVVSPFWTKEDVSVKIESHFKNLNFSYRLEEKKCDSRVVVLLLTRPNGFEKRQQIRVSWANKKNLPADWSVRFIIGAQTSRDVEIELQLENQNFNDLVRYDGRDSYKNLFLKTHAIFSFVTNFCPHAQFVIKADDDADLQFLLIDNHLQNRTESFFCHKFVGARPFRNPLSRWYVPYSDYSPTVFPPYCSGTAYAVTARSIPRLLDAMKNESFIPMEDVFFTGILSQRLHIPIQSLDLFPAK
ncbi:Hexosyltransferase [Aphelenchoides besseyi]|nr:Hexosyltransferase [Aphelenchoides besseyi]